VSHSAAGRCLLVADRLITRAEHLLDVADNVPDCLRAATLALIAQELLACKTPTAAFEALAIRHQAEVKAECMFYGATHSIETRNRFREIAKEVWAVAQFLTADSRENRRARQEVELRIVNSIARVFRNAGQFDEEQSCIARFRRLQYPLTWDPLTWLNLPQFYFSFLVGKLWHFVVFVLGWPVFLGVIAYLTRARFGEYQSRADERSIASLLIQCANSFHAFFGTQPCQAPFDLQANILTIVTQVLGFAHLGILISYAYTKLARK
jgi:hypothetical protein